MDHVSNVGEDTPRVQLEAWLSFFLLAIAGLGYAGFAFGMESAMLLDAAAYGSLLGAVVSMTVRAACQPIISSLAVDLA